QTPAAKLKTQSGRMVWLHGNERRRDIDDHPRLADVPPAGALAGKCGFLYRIIDVLPSRFQAPCHFSLRTLGNLPHGVIGDDGGVADEAVAAGTREGGMAEALTESVVGEREQLGGVEGLHVGLRLKSRFGRDGGLAIPGADLLADVAAEEPVAHAGV